MSLVGSKVENKCNVFAEIAYYVCMYNPFILINIGQFTLGVFDVKIILPYSYSANVPGQYI